MKKHFVTIIASFLACVGLLYLASWKSTARTQTQAKSQVKIKNDAESLQVISHDIQSFQDLQLLNLKLKNTSTKKIVYFKLGSCAGRTFLDMDATISGEGDGIPPGGIFDAKVPLERLSKDCSAVSLPPTVTVQAVVFDDHTNEGDSETAFVIRSEQLGQKTQMAHIKHLIATLLNSSKEESLQMLNDIESAILSLPDKEDGQTPGYNFGLSNAKKIMLEQIKELQEWERGGRKISLHRSLSSAKDVREGLARVDDELKKRISSY